MVRQASDLQYLAPRQPLAGRMHLELNPPAPSPWAATRSAAGELRRKRLESHEMRRKRREVAAYRPAGESWRRPLPVFRECSGLAPIGEDEASGIG
jgi:hypothetical protein